MHMRRRTAHDDAIIVTPADLQCPAGQGYVDRPIRSPKPGGGHSNGASGRTAGKREARTTLPSPHFDSLPVDYLCETDVSPVGKQRVVFEKRPKLFQVMRVGGLDPKDGVRVTHAGNGRRAEDWRANRTNVQFDVTCVSEGFGQRNVLPAELRLTHVNRDLIRRRNLYKQQPVIHGTEEPITARLLVQDPANAAHSVPAGSSSRPVAVVNAKACIKAVGVWCVNDHKLVERRLGALCDRLGLIAAHHVRAIAQIEHDDLVAKPVHGPEGI